MIGRHGKRLQWAGWWRCNRSVGASWRAGYPQSLPRHAADRSPGAPAFYGTPLRRPEGRFPAGAPASCRRPPARASAGALPPEPFCCVPRSWDPAGLRQWQRLQPGALPPRLQNRPGTAQAGRRQPPPPGTARAGRRGPAAANSRPLAPRGLAAASAAPWRAQPPPGAPCGLAAPPTRATNGYSAPPGPTGSPQGLMCAGRPGALVSLAATCSRRRSPQKQAPAGVLRFMDVRPSTCLAPPKTRIK